MRGFVYVLSNRAMPGLLKVGYTTRSIMERLDELNSTGVPTSFVIEFYFEVDNAPLGESMLHRSLGKHHYEKEFFKVSVSKVVEESKRLLSSNNFVVYGFHGRAKDSFLTISEQEELKRQAEASQAKKKSEDELQKRREAEAKIIGDKFLSLCPQINAVLKTKSVLGGGGIVREVASLALIFTVVGMGVADKLSPVPIKDGEMMAAKLTQSERNMFIEFNGYVKKLIDLNFFDKYACAWTEKIKPNDFITSREEYAKNERRPSDLLCGVFYGLGLR
jgi:hypothetical protein